MDLKNPTKILRVTYSKTMDFVPKCHHSLLNLRELVRKKDFSQLESSFCELSAEFQSYRSGINQLLFTHTKPGRQGELKYYWALNKFLTFSQFSLLPSRMSGEFVDFFEFEDFANIPVGQFDERLSKTLQQFSERWTALSVAFANALLEASAKNEK